MLELDNDESEAVSSTKVKTYATFASMGLNENLLKGIFSYGFEKPSLIQRKAIKQIISGGDVIAQAQSGSGKTATFAIGVLQSISLSQKLTQALVIAPTRELASQIHKVISSLADYLPIRCLSSCGGQSKGGIMAKELQKGAQVVVGTPGRILDLLRHGLNTSFLKVIVIDEADEMMNKGLKEQLFKIFHTLNHYPQKNNDEEADGLPAARFHFSEASSTKQSLQVIVVSATLPKSCNDLIVDFTRDPVKILVPRDELSLAGIHQCYIDVGEEKWKFEAVTDIFASVCIPQSVLFVSSRKKVDWLYTRLSKEGFTVIAAHGEMEQQDRDKVIEKFRSGHGRILICTDIWSRGIDVHTVGLVINFDMPSTSACYLHRIGRSGRFGRRGLAISLLAGAEDRKLLESVAKHYQISVKPAPKPLSKLMEHFNQHDEEHTPSSSKLAPSSEERVSKTEDSPPQTTGKKRRRKKRKAKASTTDTQPDSKKVCK